jgi:hypothetical protein
MKTCLLALLVGLSTALVAHAQPVSGSYPYQFSGTNLPLFYFNVNFSTNASGLSETVAVALTPLGRLRGSYSAHYDAAGAVFDFGGKLAGRFSGNPPYYQVDFSGHGPLQGSVLGRPVSGTQSLRATASLDPTTGYLTGTEFATVCLSGYGCRTESQPLSFEIAKPGSGEGDWSLVLTITNRHNRISGTAQATVGDGHMVSFRVSGAYSPRQSRVKLQLRGKGDAVGVLIQFEADPAMKLQSMRGKIFGQHIDTSGGDL